ncbi:hypothetical protein ACIRD3_39755 [Kitasatospora sp. NPDC093550]|uniref:hypothetical protein n=1 Tax=Kitasatospora sp. NPDC093550 TaxID=3364089 RepID=UPI00381C1609
MDYVDRLAAELSETALDPRLVRLVDAVLDSPGGAQVLASLDRIAAGEGSTGKLSASQTGTADPLVPQVRPLVRADGADLPRELRTELERELGTTLQTELGTEPQTEP